jgi:antitoxin component of MazEF toxin-antitoxin module
MERRIYKKSRTATINLPIEFIRLLNIEINEIVNVELVNDKIVITKIDGKTLNA